MEENDKCTQEINLNANFMYVCLCIIYENDERYQLDATI